MAPTQIAIVFFPIYMLLQAIHCEAFMIGNALYPREVVSIKSVIRVGQTAFGCGWTRTRETNLWDKRIPGAGEEGEDVVFSSVGADSDEQVSPSVTEVSEDGREEDFDRPTFLGLSSKKDVDSLDNGLLFLGPILLFVQLSIMWEMIFGTEIPIVFGTPPLPTGM